MGAEMMVALRTPVVLFVALVLAAAQHASAFSTGAPSCDQPCPSMGPDSGPAATPNPFETLFVDSDDNPVDTASAPLAAGAMYQYHLYTTSPGTPMEGFLVDARVENSGTLMPAGQFDPLGGAYKEVDACSHAHASAWTHDGPFSTSGETQVSMLYIAPMIPASSADTPFMVNFHTVMVEDGGRWWQEDVLVEVACMSAMDCEPVDCKKAVCVVGPGHGNVCSYESDMDQNQARCHDAGTSGGFCSAGACMACTSDADCDTGSPCRSSTCDVPSGSCTDTLVKAENDSCGAGDEVCTGDGDCVHCFTEPTPFTLCDKSCGGGSSYSYRAKSDMAPMGCDAGASYFEEEPCNMGACDGSECPRTGLHYFEGDAGSDTDDQVVSSQCPHADPQMCAMPMVMAGVPYWAVNQPGEGMVSNAELDTCGAPPPDRL